MKGILLINTGSPRTTDPKDVKEYLIEFLTDPRVMDMPKLLREVLVRGVIAPLRAPRSAEKYRHIFTSDGEALLVKECKVLAEMMHRRGEGVPVYVSMRYGSCPVEKALKAAKSDGVTELMVVPLFPHYAMSSYETALEHVQREYRRLVPPYKLTTTAPYYDHPLLLEAFIEEMQPYLLPGDRVLCSYHGIPLSQTKPYEGNPSEDYLFQTKETTRLLSLHPLLSSLGLEMETVYQSQFLGGKWTTPNTQARLSELRDRGEKRVVVVCPGFLCDNLETVFEIGVEGQELFGREGGKLIFVPSPGGHSSKLADLLLDVAGCLVV